MHLAWNTLTLVAAFSAGCTGEITLRTSDGGPLDSSSALDAGSAPPGRDADAGPVDAGPVDAGPVDAGAVDAAAPRPMDGGTSPPPCGAGSAGDEAGLLAHRSGFARAVTGGAGGAHIVLDSLDESAFVAAISGPEPKWVSFAPGLSGEIVITSNVDIGSNTTIDGRGANIVLTAPGGCHEIRFWGEDHENLIIHNLTFHRVGTGDNCGQGFGMAFGAHTVWIDHCTFSENGDESLSTGIGATDLTISFSRFYNTEKGTLLGWGPGYEEDVNTRVTVHHSAYLTGPDRSPSRIPKLRRGLVHFVNNVVDGWGWSAVEVTMGGQGRIEYNIFDGHDDSNPAMVCNADGYDPEGGFICDESNLLDRAVAHGPGDGFDCSRVFAVSEFYEYEVDPADDALRSLVLDEAGRADDPQWCRT